MSRLSLAFLVAVACLTSSPVFAIKAGDVMEKMSEDERFGYLTGLADMLSYQYVLAGDRPRAECITNAFYSKKEDTWRRVYESFKKLPDKGAEGLIVVLMKQECGQ